MAARHLTFEAPRPFSVLSENHVRTSLDLPKIPEHERFSFGSEYDKEMCRLIDKHLEVRMCTKLVVYAFFRDRYTVAVDGSTRRKLQCNVRRKHQERVGKAVDSWARA